jgi:hypothetical protein
MNFASDVCLDVGVKLANEKRPKNYQYKAQCVCLLIEVGGGWGGGGVMLCLCENGASFLFVNSVVQWRVYINQSPINKKCKDDLLSSSL